MLKAVYDLRYFPPNFEMVHFLVHASNRFERPFDLYIVHPHRFRKYAKARNYSKENIEERIKTIVLEVPRLFPMVASINEVEDRYSLRGLTETFPRGFNPDSEPHRVYRIRSFLDLMPPKHGIVVPQEALDWASRLLKGIERPLVVSLREDEYAPDRNSDIEAWLAFLDHVKDECTPILLRDHAKAGEKLSRFKHLDEASTNVILRAAVLQKAWLCMHVDSGNGLLATWNPKVRYINFPHHSSRFKGFIKHGLVPGEQPPFCGPFQKWCWESENDPEIMYKEFKMMKERLE